MAEPKVSYKGLKDSSFSFLTPKTGLQQLIVAVTCMILSTFSIVDAVPTTTASIGGKTVNLPRTLQGSLMLNDGSMPADDIQDFSSSSDYESLPISVQVAEDCASDQFLDQSGVCRDCTTCGPGTQHGKDERCGYGNGFEQICEPCADEYYQSGTSSSLVRCHHCITCDTLAETIQECSPVKNTECGPCPAGKYYYFPNICFPCEFGGSNKEECMTTKHTTPASTTKTMPPSSPILTTDAVPVDVLVTQSTMNTTLLNQTERPANSTEQPNPGGTKKIGVYIGVTVFVVAVPAFLGAFCLFKILKKRRSRNNEDTTGEKGDVDDGSKSGDPGVILDQARYITGIEAVVLGARGYNLVRQEDLPQDGTDLSLPQPLRSDLPIDNGQEPVEQNHGG